MTREERTMQILCALLSQRISPHPSEREGRTFVNTAIILADEVELQLLDTDGKSLAT